VREPFDLLRDVKEAGSDLRVDDGKVKLVRPGNLYPSLSVVSRVTVAVLLAILRSPPLGWRPA
jgi:hypothetical protein